MSIERTKQKLLALGYTESDLKTPRPLTPEEFKAMSVDLQEWHLLANSAAIQKMDAEIAKREAEAAAIDDADADRFWGRATPEETNATLEMAARFCRKFAQFVQVPENTQLVVEWLKEHRRSKPQMHDFEQCFAALCRGGSISIDLSKIGEGDRIITGYELRTSPIMYKILEPATLTAAQKKQKEIERMSADQFLKATPELHDKRISPILKAQFDKAVVTLESFHPEYDRTIDGNNKILLDYIAQHQQGVPFQSSQLLAAFDATKHLLQLKSNVSTFGATKVVDYTPRKSTSELLDGSKLRKKVNSMSSAEYAAWCKDNPSAATALDALA